MNSIQYARKAIKQLIKLHPNDSKTVRNACDLLANMPSCVNVKALTNHEYGYRLRVGNYRVFFNFDGVVRIVSIEEVKKEMNALINNTYEPVQFLRGAEGLPAYAVLPYDYYQALIKSKVAEVYIPSEVVNAFFDKGISPVKAWREYLGLTQADMCERLKMTQGAYSQLESKKSIRKSSREKLAAAFGINAKQLDF